MRDPLIRSYHETPPFQPGLDPVRFRWPGRHEQDVRKIRESVQDGGKGLYVLIDPAKDCKALVEAYYPEDIRPSYAKPERVQIETSYGNEVVTMSDQLNPYQYEDFRVGRLVCIAVEKRYVGELDGKDIVKIRKGNANARKDLRRNASAWVRAQNMRTKAEREEDKKIDEFSSIGDTFDEEASRIIKPHSYGGL